MSYDFEFTNTGNQPVTIGRVTASCGCTTPDWTKTPVLPGKKGYIKVTYDPKNRPGAFTKSISVPTNDPTQPKVILYITGKVTRERTLADEYPIKIGELRLVKNAAYFTKIKNTEIRTETIRIVNDSQSKLSIGFANVPQHLKVEAKPSSLEPKQKGVLVIEYNARKKNQWDYVYDRFFFVLNGERQNRQTFRVIATIVEDFSQWTEKEMENAPRIKFDQTKFDFGTIKQGEHVEHEYKFTNTGKSPLLIRRVKASCGCTATNLSSSTIEPGQSGSIKATFSSTGRSGKQTKTITVISNDPHGNNSRVVLWLKGNVEKP